MDNTTYPGSGTGVDDACDYHSMMSTELDFVNHWLNATVQNEVLRGSKLREEKQRVYPCQNECDVLNIEYIKSPCQGHKKITGRSKYKAAKCASPKSYSQRNRNCSPSSYSYRMQHCYTSPHSCSVKTRSPPRCSLRIAELAVPSKRQCIDTWRYKCDILPACMVERLRQQVMDEQPIAQITDAINCFKRRKPKTVKRPKKLSRESKMKNDNLVELRKLCALFGNKLAQRLLTPKHLKLNPELQKISYIVADEIANIMKRRKANINNLDDKMHAEISEKIAVWIATVLEDTSYKLLEDDLRVQKKAERAIKEDRLQTLVKLLRFEKPPELEEEEGPVLDFIDDVLDNVTIICNPQVEEVGEQGDYSEITSKVIGEQYDRRSKSPDSLENNELDTSTLYTNMTYDTGNMTRKENSDMELEELRENFTPISSKDDLPDELKAVDMQNEITINIDSLTGDDHTENEQIDNDESTVKNKSSNEEIINDDVDVLKDNTVNNEISDKMENQAEQQYLSANSGQLVLPLVSDLIPIEDVTLDSESSAEFKVDNGPTNDLEGPKPDSVSDVFEIFTEESSNKENKTVQFTEIDLGGGIKSSLAGTKNPEHLLNDPKHSLTFAPPNENLLSDADESWPEDITTPVVKPTASIIKSITSLGRIVEKDERLSMVTDKLIINQNNLDVPDINQLHKQRSKDIKDSNLELPSSKKTSSQEIHNRLSDEIHSIILTEKNYTQNRDNISGTVTDKIQTDSQIEQSHKILGSVSGSLQSLNKNYEMSSKWDDKRSKNANDANSEPNIKHATSEIKIDYRVHPSTAPSWVRYNHGKGEPSEFPLGGRYGKINKEAIYSWCKDMERMFTNLDLWNRWLNAVCKDMLRLKQKREMYKMCDTNINRKIVKEWLKLYRNVKKDAVLWTKLKQRDHGQLKMYKQKANRHDHECSDLIQPSDINKAISDITEEINKISLWLHRTIVSTKYCMLCNCHNIYNAKEKS